MLLVDLSDVCEQYSILRAIPESAEQHSTHHKQAAVIYV